MVFSFSNNTGLGAVLKRTFCAREKPTVSAEPPAIERSVAGFISGSQWQQLVVSHNAQPAASDNGNGVLPKKGGVKVGRRERSAPVRRAEASKCTSSWAILGLSNLILPAATALILAL